MFQEEKKHYFEHYFNYYLNTILTLYLKY
uniref:Uncharacterized protein n=1 Tax=Anguilla anguilla TaxID=7936 RepID=A0A0E9TC38_ANGAN